MANQPAGTVTKLAENATVGTVVNWPGGPGMFTAEATFGGGSVKLQVRTQKGTFVDVGADTSLLAAGAAGFLLPPCQIQVLITTATAVFAYVTQM